jgi:hypothetical protein
MGQKPREQPPETPPRDPDAAGPRGNLKQAQGL